MKLALATAAVASTLTAHAHAATIEQQIRRAFAPYGQSSTAVCIANAESRLRPWAVGGTHVGLFQISYYWHARQGESFASFRARESQAAVNIAHAVRLYVDARRRWGYGWLPWTTRGLCGA